jgi:glycosyltransferase involved in cell wall biosynthesis
MRKLAIVHFNPIEKYPPVTNWLEFLAGSAGGQWEVRVFTSHQDRIARDGVAQNPYHPAKKFIAIHRFGRMAKGKPFLRYLAYFNYYTRTFFGLITWRPDIILYYETLSAFPPLLYKKLWRSSASLFAHYHEYITPEEYANGMLLNKWFHRWEKKNYGSYAWISHTNDDRMDLFMKENTNILPFQAHILPNYPPSRWKSRPITGHGDPIKMVYVGALSLDTVYTAEFAKWVEKQNGRASWDIYSSNFTEEARNYIESLNSAHIRFRGGVEYASLPDILKEYDVGLVLYKGTIPNYVYNIPNKLFEYFACGLDVWFAMEMTTAMTVATTGVYPKLVAVDFKKADQWRLDALLDRTGLAYSPSPFHYEQVLQGLLDKINNKELA